MYNVPGRIHTYYPLPFEDNKEAMEAICKVCNEQNQDDIGVFSISEDIPVSVKAGIDIDIVQIMIGKHGLNR